MLLLQYLGALDKEKKIDQYVYGHYIHLVLIVCILLLFYLFV